MLKCLLLAGFICLCPTLAWAQGAPEAPSFATAILQMVAALAVVLALLLALYWLMRRFAPSHMLGGAGGLKVWARLGLGPRKSVVLLEVGRKMLLLGLSDKELTLLRQVDDAEEIAELKSQGSQVFKRALKREREK